MANSRIAKIEKRQEDKARWQQKYRDERRGEPDNRRIAVAMLAVVLELDASASDPAAYDALFARALEKLPLVYRQGSGEARIKKLRADAYDVYEDKRLHKKLRNTQAAC